ncbi:MULTISPECIES: VOC family protein [unclassified Fusibacter]|uniref:VOC family protein n=1 Tax=unclassified Fusibacter TaxID=2624464 RepID=UPI001010838A|nr:MULTISPECIES: VOC family protein [unclassified Fusibacter]MCK8058931.1 VOC family protein [Fusibacter sp. A2]NPE22007.1 VOC family protein [Fusibacter sp. A1]RXV61572.1 VOC family protein [Fusibacter sp. A1]
MRFCWTTLHVKDLDVSLDFYQRIVGLELNRRFKPNEHVELAFLGGGTTELELICDSGEPESPVKGISVGFMVDSTLEDVMATLTENGFNDQSEVYVPNPMMRFFYVKDPDGFKVQFVEDRR